MREDYMTILLLQMAKVAKFTMNKAFILQYKQINIVYKYYK